MMRFAKSIVRGKDFFLMIIMLLTLDVTAMAQDVPLSVIGNTSGTPEELKFTELKSILKGERQRWKDGTKIVIALMKTNTPAGNSTCSKVYNMSGDEVNKFWLALVFQGKAQAPSFFNSVSELETYVAQTPGAIGVVSQAASSENKVINIDGKKLF